MASVSAVPIVTVAVSIPTPFMIAAAGVIVAIFSVGVTTPRVPPSPVIATRLVVIDRTVPTMLETNIADIVIASVNAVLIIVD